MAQRNALQNHMQGNDNRQMTQTKPNGAQLASFLEKHKGQFAAALPKHLNPDRMIRLALTAFNSNRALQNCDMNSIAASIVMASQLGLEIGVAGQAFLVPYKGKCQCIPGWQGFVDLVSRSGRATVWTGAVFEGDEFDFALGDSPFVRHRPGGEDDPSKLICVYSVGRVNGSQWPVIEVWPIAKVRRHFNKNNKVGDAHYANGNWEMYARKIPLLQVIKYMPKSIELTNALMAEQAYETGHTYTITGDTVTIDNDPPGIEHGGDNQGSDGKSPFTAQEVHDALTNAKTEQQLQEAGDLIRELPASEHGALNALWQKRADELAA